MLENSLDFTGFKKMMLYGLKRLYLDCIIILRGFATLYPTLKFTVLFFKLIP